MTGMGNESSTRWGTTIVRLDTDPLPKLDVRWLSRIGALIPGSVSQPAWERNGILLSVIACMDPHTSNALVLQYLTDEPGGGLHPVMESVGLTFTPCTFGGQRAWFLCPGCQSRRGVLFFLGGRFLCRICHNLAYSSTRRRRRAA